MAEKSAVITMTEALTTQSASGVLASAYAVFDQVSDAIIILDPSGKCLYLNAKAESLFDTRDHTLSSELIQDMISPPSDEFSLRIKSASGLGVDVRCILSQFTWLGKDALLLTASAAEEQQALAGELKGRMESTSSELELLREGEERYKIFSEVISDYAYTRVRQPDGGWRTEWVSDTIRKMITDPAELDRFQWNPYIVESDAQKLAAHQEKVRTGESHVAEFRIQKPGENVLWVREYSRPVRTTGTGVVDKIYAVGQDITERRTMRLALHEFERRFRVMLEHLSLISVILDTHGKLAFCNDYFLNLTGYARDEILSVNWFDTFIPDDVREQVERIYDNTIALGEFPIHHENEICTRDGSLRLISWTNTILQDTKGNVIGTASIGEDVTDRRIAEHKLRESEARYRQLFTIEPDALIVHELISKRIVEANDAALALYGYTRDEILGMQMQELSAEPEQTVKAIDQMRSLRRCKIPLRYHKHHDGSVFAVEINSGLFINEQCELVYASIRDISERVNSERELITAKQRAELSDELKDAFIANMSHEIRTPLNIILGYTGIIETDLGAALPEEQRDYFRCVERAGSRLQRTVEQLLNLSSLQVGTYTSKIEEFDLCQGVDFLVYDMISLAHTKDVALEVMHESSPVPVCADKYLVEQALANILDNAIKFTATGGVFVRVQVRDQFARVEVRDTGIGISEDYLPRIFTMFSQEILGYTRPFDGLGIGLALTKMYMTEVGGEVHIESAKGKGTIVTLEIPIVGGVAARTGAVADAGLGYTAQPRKHVLLIEDDALTQKYMTIALQGTHNLTFAESTEEALNILSYSPVDLIMLDLYMKGSYDGLNTAKTIKSISASAHIPIVVVTAHEKPGDRLRCEEAGCSEFLLKPLRRAELEETITRLTANR